MHAAAVRHYKGISKLLATKVKNGMQIHAWVASRQEDAKKQALYEHLMQRKSQGSTATTGLRWAVSEGRLVRVLAILKNGADINAEDVGGCTALTTGGWMGQLVTVQLLLENGADVNRCERSGRSALHMASEHGYYDIMQMLVEHSANIDICIYGFTPMLLAAKNRHSEVLKYLVQKEADITPRRGLSRTRSATLGCSARLARDGTNANRKEG